MPSVDNRVVEMQFDNKQFESGVNTSIKSLDKLKKGLDLDKSAKSLSNLEKTAKGFNLSGIANGVETIASRFSTLGIIGVTALQNITTAAMNAGARITEALTIQPIKMGFQEYETQINAVQTILANTSSKGTTLQQVNNALDELNKYADMTIYNFTEMTRNIGTFTAAGVDLDTSVSAIKGIANLAAVSGSTSQQAATAMYQLSQALAAGTVKLQDWNSVVNAGMGGQVFQDSLKETARVHGVAIDDMIAKEGSFRETLKDGWLTSEILTETLAKFTGDLSEEQLKNMGYTEEQTQAIMKMGETANDAATKVKTFTQLFDTLNEAMQSGWTQSWEYIIGDYEEAKETLTQLSDMFSDIINQSAEGRNQILKEWSELGGRTELFGALLSAIEAIFSYIRPVQEGFKEIIPPITGQKLYDLTLKLHQFMESMKLSEETANRVKEVAKNFAQAFKNIMDAVVNATGGFDGFKRGLNSVRDGVLTFLLAVSNFVKGITEGINVSGLFGSALSAAGEGLSIFGRLLTGAANLITIFAQGLTTLVTYAAQAFSGALGSAGTFAAGFVTILQTIIEAIPQVLGTAIKAIGSVVRDILQALPIHELNATIQDTLFTVILARISGFLKKSKKSVEEATTIFDKFGEIAESITGVLEQVGGSIKSFARSIQADALLKISVALGILAASLWVLAQIPLEQLGLGLGALATGMLVFTGISIATFAILKKIAGNFKDILKISIMATQMRKIAVSMLIFAGAVRILVDALREVSALSWDELLRGLVALAGLSGIIIGISKLVSHVGGIIRLAAAMMILGTALKTMTESVVALSSLSWEALAKGLIGVASSLLILVAAAKILSKGTWGLFGSAVALLSISVALKTLTEAIMAFNDVEYGSILKSVAALFGIAGALKVLSVVIRSANIWTLVKMTAALIIVAQVLGQFGDAIKKFNEIEWGSVSKTVVSLSLILASMAAFSVLATKTNFLAISGGLWAVSEAVRTFVDAVRNLSGLDWHTLLKGIVGVSAGLAIMMAAVSLLPTEMVLERAGGLAIVAFSMRALADAMKVFGTMSLKEIAKSIIAFAGSMTIIVVAMNELTAIKGLGWAAASLTLIGLGISMIAGPISMLGKMNVSELAKGLIGLAASLTIIGVAVRVLGTMTSKLFMTAAGLTAMGVAIGVFGLGLSAMIYPVKEIAGLGLEGAISGITGIAVLIGTMYGLVEAVNRMPKISPAALGKAVLLAAVIGALGIVVDQLSQIDSKSALEAATALSEMILATSAALAILGAIQLPGAVKAIATLAVVIAGMSAIVAAMGGLAQIPGAKWLMNEGKQFLQTIGEAIGGFFGAIAGGFVGTALTVASTALPGLGKSLSQFANNARPFFDTVSGIDSNLGNNVANLAAAVLMITGADVLGSATAWLTGGNSMEKFGQSLAAFAPYFKEYADQIKDIDAGAVEGSANAAKALAEMANALPKEGGLLQDFTGTNDLVTFAEKLVPFGEALKKYSEVVKGLDVESIRVATEAAQGLADLYNSLDNIGGVVGWFEGERDMGKFGEGIVKLAGALVDFSKTVAGNLDPEAISQATDALQRLADINNSLDNIGGVVSWFEGEKDLSYFARGIKSLGEAIKDYSNEVSGANFDEGKITGSINALRAMADIQSALPNIGGIASFFQGAPQMSYFAEGVKDLGSAIADYCEAVSGKDFDAGKVTQSIEALKALSEINNASEKIGGLMSIFEGEPNLEYFSKGIVALGEAIANYCEAVSGKEFDAAKVSQSIEALKSLAEMQGSIEKIGGINDFFQGKTDFSGFSDGITALGEAIASYAEKISAVSFDPGQMSASVEAIKIIAEAAQILGGSGGTNDWFDGNVIESLKSFAEALGPLGEAIASFASNLGETDYSTVGPAVEAIKQVADVCNSLNEFNPDGINKFKETISNLGDMGLPQFSEELANTASTVAENMSKLRDAISEGAQGIGEAFDNLKSKLVDEGPLYEDAGKTIGESLINGLKGAIEANTFAAVSAFEKVVKDMITAGLKVITDAKPKFTAAGRNLAQAVKDGFKSAATGFNQLGRDIVQGIANGISNNSYIARNAAARAASDALAAAKSALDSNSPSKKFMQLGKDSDLGLAIGMDKFSYKVTNAASSVANDAFKASSAGIKAFNKLAVGSLLDPMDTVRPIIDAANYQNKDLKLYTGIMARNAALSTASYGVPNPVIAVDNSDVLAALDDLKDELVYLNQNGINPVVDVTLDSKTIARATAKPMNRELGYYSRRGGF